MIYFFGLILLWFRPEYRFAVFFALALPALDFALVAFFGGLAIVASPSLSTFGEIPALFVWFVRGQLRIILTFLAFAFPIVALRKWMKSRKSGDERRAERLVAEARAEAAKQPE
jgi:hypothetical protein